MSDKSLAEIKKSKVELFNRIQEEKNSLKNLTTKPKPYVWSKKRASGRKDFIAGLEVAYSYFDTGELKELEDKEASNEI